MQLYLLVYEACVNTCLDFQSDNFVFSWNGLHFLIEIWSFQSLSINFINMTDSVNLFNIYLSNDVHC